MNDIGETVYIAADPLHLEYPEDGNVLEGEIRAIKEMIIINHKGKELDRRFVIDTGLQDVTVQEHQIYIDKNDAIDHANVLADEAIERLQKKLDKVVRCKVANSA